MFKIVANPTFTHDVPIMSPIDGGFEEEKLKTTFKFLDKDQIAQFDLRTSEGTSSFLDEIVKAFHELVDENKQPVDCSSNIRAGLLARSSVRQGLIAYYLDAVTKVKEGN